MFGIGRKKKRDEAVLDKPQISAQDKSVHKIFQIGAILVIAYIIYSIYFGKATVEDSSFSHDDAHYMSDDQLNAKVQEVVSKLLESPEFKSIKEFAEFTKNNINKDEAKILETQEGILIFVPNKLISEDKKDIKIENEMLKLNIDSERKQRSEELPADPSIENNSGEHTDGTKEVKLPLKQ